MPRALPPEERRGEILDQAFGIFAATGFHALSMRELARELHASTGVLYHWFPSKSELFAAMLERQVARQVEEARLAIQPAPRAARPGALAAHIAEKADDLQRTLVVALDWFRAEPASQPAVSGAVAAYRAALAEELAIAEAEADALLSGVLGELLLRMLDPARRLSGLAARFAALCGGGEAASGAA